MITQPLLTNDLIEKFYNLILNGEIEELKTFLSGLPDSTKEALAETTFSEYQNPLDAAVRHNQIAIVDELLQFKKLRLSVYPLLVDQLNQNPMNIPLIKKLMNVKEIAHRLAAPIEGLTLGPPGIFWYIRHKLELVQEAFNIGPVAKAAGGFDVAQSITRLEPQVAQEVLKLQSFQQYTATHADEVLSKAITHGTTELVKEILAIPRVKSSKSLSNPAFLMMLRNCNIEIFDLVLELKPVRTGLIKNKGLISQILNNEHDLPTDFIEKVKSLKTWDLFEINSLISTKHTGPKR